MATIITIQTTIHASIEKVWECWTNPKHVLRWNFASDDWCTLKASNDLQVGGKYGATMAAKDGSFSFDFEATYDKIIPHQLLASTMGDGRALKVMFISNGNETTVTEEFEAETENSVEMQQAGWQAILDNFKKHVEGVRKLEVIDFTIRINAAADKVYKTMLDDATYRQWTAEFNPTSHYKGTWAKGTKMLFIGMDENGNAGGMVSRVRENIPGQFISIEHLGLVKDNEEITSGAEVEGWAGSLENYTFKTDGNATIVEVDMDSNPDFKSYFETMWPKALQKLKSICESN
jgi:uncharacterized protein YndB with AHSA1/START domain